MIERLRIAFVKRHLSRLSTRLDDAFDAGDVARVKAIEAQIDDLVHLLILMEARIERAYLQGELVE